MTLPKVDVSRLRIRGVHCEMKRAADLHVFEFAYALQVDDVDAGTTTTVRGMTRIARGLKPDALAHVVRSALLDAISHELDECLFIDGKRARDPHPELKRPREAWETATPCDCPRTKSALLAEAETVNAGMVYVCDRAFSQLADLYRVPDPHRVFKVPVYREPSPTFTCSTGPVSSMCYTVEIIGGKEH